MANWRDSGIGVLNGSRGRHETKMEHAIYQDGFTIETCLLDAGLSGSFHVVEKGLVFTSRLLREKL